MCGIAGFFALSPRPLPPRAVLERMVEAVRHRGPDDGGVYLDERAGLGQLNEGQKLSFEAKVDSMRGKTSAENLRAV